MYITETVLKALFLLVTEVYRKNTAKLKQITTFSAFFVFLPACHHGRLVPVWLPKNKGTDRGERTDFLRCTTNIND